MAIFSRRTLQDLIDRSPAFLDPLQIHRKVDIFNQAREAAIPAEWELALLHAFARLGKVVHEGDFGGTTRPDVHYTPENSPSAIAIDIAVVSDKHLREENPYDPPMDEMLRLSLEEFNA